MVDLKPWNPDSRKIFAKVFGDSTLIALSKLMERGNFDQMMGEIARGKEACVFVGTKRMQGPPVAIKVYRVETVVFQSTLPYIKGDSRFANFRKKNTRALVFMWVRKEYGNLLRLRNAGLPVPEPVAVLENVLVMTFFGDRETNIPALVLKDVWKTLSKSQLEEIYKRLADFVIVAYKKAGLVHADLSEYNVLIEGLEVGKAIPIVIDCAQAVLKNHPNAKTFLLRDCHNLTKFFSKNTDVEGVHSPQELFDLAVATPPPPKAASSASSASSTAAATSS